MFWKSWLCKDWWRAPKTISFLSIRNSWISERAGDASYLSSQQSWLIIVTCVAIWSTCSPDSSVPSCDDQSQIIPLHPFSLDFDLTLAENIFGTLLTFSSRVSERRWKQTEEKSETRQSAGTSRWGETSRQTSHWALISSWQARSATKDQLVLCKVFGQIGQKPNPDCTRSSWSGTWSSASTGARRSNWSRF